MKGTTCFHTVVTVECEYCILYSILKLTPNSHSFITLYNMLKVCMYVGSICVRTFKPRSYSIDGLLVRMLYPY